MKYFLPWYLPQIEVDQNVDIIDEGHNWFLWKEQIVKQVVGPVLQEGKHAIPKVEKD